MDQNRELIKFDDDRDVATLDDLIQETSEAQSEIEPFELLSGKIIFIKPLSRKQALGFKGSSKMPRALFEQRAVAMAMVNPKMTPAQVSKWQDRDKANGDLHRLTDRIIEISGMKEKISDPEDPKSNGKVSHSDL